MMYQPKIGQDSSFKALNWPEAQEWCNFVLFQPTLLPDGMKIVDQQLRPESHAEPSTYRCEIAGQGRKLSIKQFLYDWAPPAYDHPSLWRNNKVSSIEETPIPRPYEINGDIAWIGWNFKKQPALAICLKRTTIEITSIEGGFSDQELIDLCKGLTPVDQKQTVRILETPFSSLSYFFRHSKTASDVPLSYWKYNRQKDWAMNASQSSAIPEHVLIPSSYGYRLNSIFYFGNSSEEIEFYYEHRDLPGSYLRVLATPANQKYSIPYPPRLGDQSCHTQILNIQDKNVYHAYLSDSYGPHELIWQHQHFTLLMLIKPARWTSLSWLHRLMNDILLINHHTEQTG